MGIYSAVEWPERLGLGVFGSGFGPWLEYGDLGFE